MSSSDQEVVAGFVSVLDFLLEFSLSLHDVLFCAAKCCMACIYDIKATKPKQHK